MRRRGQKDEARHRRRCTESEVHEIVGNWVKDIMLTSNWETRYYNR
jgi:hypothetical protein